MSLDDLTDIILASFDFDKDHLYTYYYKDLFGNTIDINSPNSYDKPFTTEKRKGKTLSETQTLKTPPHLGRTRAAGRL